MVEVVSLQEKLQRTRQYWSPKIVGDLNEIYVKVVSSSCPTGSSTAPQR
jgi:hypothetical protein